ncbi:MAG: hypothetical protein JW715_13720 [Sedimentisphaerales bacterium]|nr:hypothetical protein [Sedimentisphaerales bacterium]
MKPNVYCAFVIAMLFVSTVAFGEIIYTGDVYELEDPLGSVSGTTAYHSASGYDDGGDAYGGGMGYGHGWEYIYTTEEGTYDWYGYVYAWAEAELFLFGNPELYSWASAYAEAYIYIGSTWPYFERHFTASASVFYTDDPLEDYEGAYSDYYDGSDYWFYENEGVDSEHWALAWASVTGANNSGYCHACARAWGDMW